MICIEAWDIETGTRTRDYISDAEIELLSDTLVSETLKNVIHKVRENIEVKNAD